MKKSPPLVLIRGAGDLASGIALRFFRAGFGIVMTEIAAPTTVRQTVAFSRAVREGAAIVEGLRAERAERAEEALALARRGIIAVLVDASGKARRELKPDILIDAIMAKRNLGTTREDAPVVIGIGPGFCAGSDCHAVIETCRGHTLGRAYYASSARQTARENTGIPGEIGGFSAERIIRAPADGIWTALAEIGTEVAAGSLVARVTPPATSRAAAAPSPVYAALTGIVRGMLPEGCSVYEGMKCGDIDPRCEASHCFSVSDKALAVAGGALEAALALSKEGQSPPLLP
jgi:xanthine dehydrogenase accessory factor